MPVAVNCSEVPAAIDGFVGVTAIEASVAAVTESNIEPVCPERLDEMAEVPTATPVASPMEPLAFEIVATLVVAELQVACLVMSCVVLSEKVPVAVNCCMVPAAIDGFAGVTAMEVNVAAVTVSTVEPVWLESVAETLVVPTPSPVARPRDPLALEMVATDVVLEDQRTWLVMSWVDLSV